MHTLPEPPDGTNPREPDSARLGGLRADFPCWAFRLSPETDLPWEAQRHPYQLPPGGGIAWIRAASAERLRELIGGGQQIETQR